MRAAVMHPGGQVNVEEVAEAVLPGPDGVIVHIEATAICGSDLHLLHLMQVVPEGPVLHPGHEAIGTIVEAGPEVATLKVGDRVIVSAVVGCGRCGPCRSGDPAGCSAGATAVHGAAPGQPGAQAEYLGVPAADYTCLRLPEGVDDDTAVLLTDILPTAYLGCQMAAITPGSSVAVVGAGPVGLLAVECAKLFSPAEIYCVDLLPERLARAESRGAIPISNANGDAVAQVIEATGGRGAPHVVEAIGADATVAAAISMTAHSGTTSVIGVNLNPAAPLPMDQIFMKRLTLRSALVSVPELWGHLVPLVENGQRFGEGIFTHRLGLSEVGEAYALFNERREGVEKVVLDPSR